MNGRQGRNQTQDRLVTPRAAEFSFDCLAGAAVCLGRGIERRQLFATRVFFCDREEIPMAQGGVKVKPKEVVEDVRGDALIPGEPSPDEVERRTRPQVEMIG